MVHKHCHLKRACDAQNASYVGSSVTGAERGCFYRAGTLHGPAGLQDATNRRLQTQNPHQMLTERKRGR